MAEGDIAGARDGAAPRSQPVIRYVVGDATAPDVPGEKVLVHICNDAGKWGAGFVLAVSRRWKEPERVYRESQPRLGDVQFVRVTSDLTVANLIGQHGIRKAGSTPPIRYDAVRTGLHTVADYASTQQASVHMPRIGTGLAGGKWELIEPILIDTLVNRGLAVFVYDLPEGASRNDKTHDQRNRPSI